MYAVRDKATKEIIYETSDPLPEGLNGRDVYPLFNAKKMELLSYNGNQLPQHYTVENGVVREKTSQEKLQEGLVSFGKNLFMHIDFDAASTDLPNKQLVNAGLTHGLIKTIEDCELAFLLLDEEFEARVSQKFRPGLEVKIMKDYSDWMAEGKPVEDKREQKYLDMKQTIDTLKDEYKDVRAKIKEIIIPLKEQEV